MTKRARVSAVKSLSNRLAQRRMPRIINDHRRPRERLQSDPMQSDGATECDDRGDPASATKHDSEASERIAQCQSS